MRPALRIFFAASISMVALSCETTPDLNPQAFHTPDQTLAARWAGQKRAWKESARDILKLDRPDIHAEIGEDFGLIVRSDSLTRSIDFTPIEARLKATPDDSPTLLRDHLTTALADLDQERLLTLPFDRIRGQLRVMPMSQPRHQEISATLDARGRILATAISPEVYRVPIVAWSPRSSSPIGEKALAAWGVSPSELDSIALANTAADARPDAFESIPFGGAGRIGRLKPDANLGIVFTPAFLQSVRAAWNTTDDIALLLGHAGNVQFVESRNKTLLDSIYPRWRDASEKSALAITTKPLLVTDAGLAPMKYDPPVKIFATTTQPISSMLSTRPAQERMALTRPATPKPGTARPGIRGPAKPHIAR